MLCLAGCLAACVTAVSATAARPASGQPATRVMTCNVRITGLPEDETAGRRWEDRRDACLKAIRMYRPDVICMQEVIYDSYNYFKEKFSDYVAYGFAGPEMDPYTEGLIKEEYAENGWMGTPAPYVQFAVDANGQITYEPFCTGMMVNAKYTAYAYYPGEYIWGKDFSEYNKENKKLSDKVLQLYPVYCLPEYQYGFLNDGAYPLTVTLP